MHHLLHTCACPLHTCARPLHTCISARHICYIHVHHPLHTCASSATYMCMSATYGHFCALHTCISTRHIRACTYMHTYALHACHIRACTYVHTYALHKCMCIRACAYVYMRHSFFLFSNLQRSERQRVSRVFPQKRGSTAQILCSASHSKNVREQCTVHAYASTKRAPPRPTRSWITSPRVAPPRGARLR